MTDSSGSVARRDPLQSLSAFGLYAFWLLLAPMAILGCLVVQLRTERWTFAAADVVLAIVFLLAHVARTVQPPPSAGQDEPPLTLAQWRVRFSLFAVAVWCLGQSLEVLA